MTVTSTIPAFKAALFTALAADSRLAEPVNVSYGYPGTRRADDIVALLDVDGDQTTAQLGAQRREENYVLHVLVSCYRGGEDQQTVTERAFALVAVVEDIFRSQFLQGAPGSALASLVRFAQIHGAIALRETNADSAHEGRLAEVSFEITVQNRI